MSQKALMFKDIEAHKKIMSELEAAKIKYIGSAIKGYSKEKWQSDYHPIVIKGLMAKFTNPKLKAVLLGTGEKEIIEASTDEFWGVGLSLRSDKLFSKSKWSGLNTMGKALMEIRETFK